jgi:heptosyltransferase III
MVKDAVPLGECRRALVLKLAPPGEVAFAAPVLKVLKAHAPRLEVDALVYDDAAAALAGHPALAQLHVVGRGWEAAGFLTRLGREAGLFRSLRVRRYELIVHLSEDARGAWLARLLGASYSVAPHLDGRGKLWRSSFTHLYLRAARRPPVELNLDALRRIGVYPAANERGAASA